jgi:hypothetical protein
MKGNPSDFLKNNLVLLAAVLFLLPQLASSQANHLQR